MNSSASDSDAVQKRISGWNDRYSDKDSFAFGTAPNDFLKETLPTLQLFGETKKCLLLADGEGRNGVYMAEEGFDVVSVDFSAAGLEKAQALAKTRNVQIATVQADLADYDLGTQQWDCIVGIYCHFPPAVRTKVLAAIPKALKPGGYFVLECYTPDQVHYKTGGPPTPEPLYTKRILADALGDALKVIRNEELERNVVEGKYHTCLLYTSPSPRD